MVDDPALPADDDAAVQARLTEIDATARRRWWLHLVPMWILLAVVLPIVETSGRHEQTSGVLGGIAAGIVGVGVSAAVLWFFVRRRPESNFWNPPLSLGLHRADRRIVVRGLRHGSLVADPVLRHVQRQAAMRLRRPIARAMPWLVACAGVGLVAFAATMPATASRVIYGVLAAMTPYAVWQQCSLTRGATKIVGSGF